MKLAYLITRANHGGAQVHLLELVRALRADHEIVVYTGETGYLTEQLAELRISWRQVPEFVHPIQPGKDLAAVRALRALLRANRPDVLHAHTAKAGVVGRLAAAGCGLPNVYTPHGWTFSRRSTLLRRAAALPVEWACGRLNSWVITVSEWERQLGRKAGVTRSSRTVTIPHGIRDSSRCHQTKRRANIVRIAMVGRFERPKDQASLVTAFSQLSDRNGSELFFVGDGPALSQTKDLAQKLDAGRVHFLGNRSDIEQLLATMDVVVLASNSECFGLCLVEAMRAALPVLATNVGAIPEVVVAGETGFLYERGNLEQMKDYLEKLVSDDYLRARLGRNGRQRYEQCYTVDRMVGLTQQLYEQISCGEQETAQRMAMSANR